MSGVDADVHLNLAEPRKRKDSFKPPKKIDVLKADDIFKTLAAARSMTRN